ncbi:DMT family transporter [Vogesella sp. LIG4]|uniref:DMT family transporter n=1 Tax=Vogesella sp. LIG4 TaxID=1192162 RepID=UPI00081F9CFE|nr:DMT family transporter [Vogesella sp. LIG4]SCK15739.1 Threonine/homoserine efflux transporter RhtA [Vogesella sp. LIG4]
MSTLAASASASPPARSLLPDLSLVVVTMLWGGSFLAVQTALHWAGAFSFVGMRFCVASLLALLLCRRELRNITRGEWLGGMAVGAVLYGSYNLQTLGLPYIPSSTSAFLTGLYVPLVPLLQLILFRERPSLAAWGGILLAFIGLLLLAGVNGLSIHLGLGETLTLVSTLTIALEICLISHFAVGCNARRMALVQLLTVALLSLGSALVSGEALPQWHPVLLLCVLGLGCTTALIQVMINWAQRTVPATRATIIYAMEPVWGGVVGWLAGEAMTAGNVGGAALIVASVLLSQLGARKPEHAPA